VSVDPALVESLHAVCSALSTFSREASEEPYFPPDVVAAGVDLIDALLKYEAKLNEVTGWSLPIRHLGPSDRMKVALNTESAADAYSAPIHVTVRYALNLRDRQDFAWSVESRFGEEFATVADAVRMLVSAETWDPSSFPDRLISSFQVDIDVQDPPV
jgi:hypothetical protein